jgi:hypothetical protein
MQQRELLDSLSATASAKRADALVATKLTGKLLSEVRRCGGVSALVRVLERGDLNGDGASVCVARVVVVVVVVVVAAVVVVLDVLCVVHDILWHDATRRSYARQA